jgi:hypothetical protein
VKTQVTAQATESGRDPGLLAWCTWGDLRAYAEGQRFKCLEFAAAWRARETPAAVRLAEYNEARAARLGAADRGAAAAAEGEGN